MGQTGKKNLLILPIILMLAACSGSQGTSPGISTSIESPTRSSGGSKSLEGIEILDFTAGSASISTNDPSSEYLLVVNSTTQSGSDSTVRLSAGGVAALETSTSALALDAGMTADSELNAEEEFHGFLRAAENIYGESGQYEAVSDLNSRAALTTPVEPVLGDVSTFNVLSTMNSLSTYNEVSGELRYSSDNLYVYVDQDNSGSISDADIQTLAHNFEDIALPRERALFGHESDINIDGHITILMTCTVNRMASSGGLVTGFFFPGDLYQRNSLNPASNAQEIFYTLVPDPEGKCGASVTADFAVNNILPGVLAHEYQHMTSFQQHVFKNKGSTEEPWLNECLSHFSEDLTGFGHENASRVKLFFAQPSRTPVVSYGAPTLPERGACYTFLRYLYEQSPNGDQFITNLYSSNLTGVGNLEAAYKAAGTTTDFDEFPEFVNRWSLALSLSETGATDDVRYNFKERAVDSQTGNLTGLCVRCDAQDGRGTVLDGPVTTNVSSYPSTNTLKGTATQFYRFMNPAEAISITSAGDTNMTGALIRLK